LLNPKLQSRIGFINPLLYRVDETTCFRDIWSGNNGGYSAEPGWDATTGLGSPLGIQLIQAVGEMTSQQTANQQIRSHSSSSR
jgi:kumamolisin